MLVELSDGALFELPQAQATASTVLHQAPEDEKHPTLPFSQQAMSAWLCVNAMAVHDPLEIYMHAVKVSISLAYRIAHSLLHLRS